MIVGNYKYGVFGNRLAITVLPNGKYVYAIPHDTYDYRQRALTQGYKNAEEMNKRHDLTHLLLANLLKVECPVMARASEGETEPTYLTGLAEDAAMALERFANALGVDLLTLAS